MHISSFLLKTAAVFAVVAGALPSPSQALEPHERCFSPLVRKEWRDLTSTQQCSYIEAVKCLMHKPAKLSSIYPAATTRFEDFAVIHQAFTPQVHFTPLFLPWHRYFIHEFEKAIRSECSWTGGLPYWDPTRDTANILQSPIFDAILGFGGNGAYNSNATQIFGSRGGGCITSGPFKDTKIHLGVGNDTTRKPGRCITRNFHTFATTRWLNPDHQALTLQQPTFDAFLSFIEGAANISLNAGLHGGGHIVVGGDMLNMWTSPTDPIFMLHHGNIDRVWAQWQALDPRRRQFEISGSLKPRLSILNLLNPPPGNITLDFEFTLGPFARDKKIKVAQVMDILGSSPHGKPAGILCNRYE